MNDDVALAILKRVDEIAIDISFLRQIVDVVFMNAGLADLTHLTVVQTARVLGIDRETARRRFRPFLERVPGAGHDRIPIEKVRSAYILSRTVKAAGRRELKAVANG